MIRTHRYHRPAVLVFSVLLVAIGACCTLPAQAAPPAAADGKLRIGWGAADITPDRPVYLSGQRHVRISQGIQSPVTATALAMESPGGDARVVMVSCDLLYIHQSVSDGVRDVLRRELPELAPESVLFSATHTHAAPGTRIYERWRDNPPDIRHFFGVEFPEAMCPIEYVAWASRQIAGAVKQAWESRAEGGIAYGIGQAVVGHHRAATYKSGRSAMYGATNRPDFSHLEGYEDHFLYALTTYDKDKKITGILVNLACPSQADENATVISADFWHETRVELRKRLGQDLFVLPQTAAAGDITEQSLRQVRAHERMLRLAGRNMRTEVAVRIADSVDAILPFIEKEIDFHPVLAHRMEMIALPRRIMSETDRDHSQALASAARTEYEKLLGEMNDNPRLRDEPDWRRRISVAFYTWEREGRVVAHFELQQRQPNAPVEAHFVRLGDAAFASNPFELYLDYGVRIQERSPAVQTFVIQLAGPGTYLPTQRGIAGGTYGTLPSSTDFGPEGGDVLVEESVEVLNELWGQK